MSALGRVAGTVSLVSGIVTAAALGGMTAQRMALQRYRQLDQVPGWGPADGFDAAPTDRSYSVDAADGVALYVEEVGAADAPLTVIFAHGWTLRLGSWYFQRVALSGRAAAPRLVFYDQRSHGRSSRAPAGHTTMRHLADDLAAVIGTAAPSGPIVLVGHSMGGMAVLALAESRPQLFADRVRAVGLVSTSAVEDGRGLNRLLQINGSNPLLPWLVSAAARYPGVFERSRTMNHDAMWLMTRALGFADPQVPAPLVDYLDEMISSTPVDVIAEFGPTLFSHDQRGALPALTGMPVLIAVGDQDRMTPPARSRAMARALPQAEFLLVPDAGHMAMMEAPEAVTDAIGRLLTVATGRRGRAAPRGTATQSGSAR